MIFSTIALGKMPSSQTTERENQERMPSVSLLDTKLKKKSKKYFQNKNVIKKSLE